MATATLAPTRGTAANEAGWPGDDFPSWISPMLVKELRQGVQSGVFCWTFLVFQVALFLVFSIQVLTKPGDGEGFSALFWLAAIVAVSIVVPLRGIGSISGERVGNGLDLLNLTRLSATRIVIGKWTALLAQSAVVAVTLLPYCTLRYFFGGVDVLTELQGLGWLMAAGAVMASAAIALSTLPLGFRIGIGVAASAAGFFAFVAIMDGGSRIFGFWWSGAAAPWGVLATMATYTFAFLEFAAARIAPPAENHAARKRIFAFLLAATWLLAGWQGDYPVAVATFLATGPLLLCYAVGAMVDRPSHVRTLFLPFRRAGVAGRLAAAVIAPGWASGLVFLTVLAGACGTGVIGFVDRFAIPDTRLVTLAFSSLLVAAIVFPLPLTIRVTQMRYPTVLYFLPQLLSFMTFAFANAFKDFTEPWSAYETGRLVTLPFPIGAACSLVAIARTMPMSDLSMVASSYTVAGLVVISVVLGAVARPWLRELGSAARLIRGDAGGRFGTFTMAPARPGRASTTRPWAWRGDDFPSWLPPMVVRELRQGVQSGVFAWTFIGIQAVMFALMTWAVGSFDGTMAGASARDFSVLFWLAIAAAIVVVVPLRGLTAVSGERLENNLDLVRLSRLSATQIIVGKWLAIAGQGLLLATALLPYLVLRYFLGGVDVVNDLEAFGWLAVTALAVTAAALALSTLPLWMRIGTCLLVAMSSFFPLVELLEDAVRGRLSFRGLSVAARLGIVACVAVYTVAFLEYAVARIAPLAENHAARKRLLAVGIAASWAIMGLFGSKDAALYTMLFTAPLVVCYAIESLLEKPVPIASLYHPFGRWGNAGRMAAAVFTPGWATAVLFVGLVSGLCMTGWFGCVLHMMGSRHSTKDDLWIATTVACLVVAAVIFPLPVLVWFPKARPRFLFYALIHLLCFLVFVYLVAVAPQSEAHSSRHLASWVIALPFPLAALPAYFQMPHSSDRGSYSAAFIIAAACATGAVLASVARPWLREMLLVGRLVAMKRRPPQVVSP